MVVRSISFQRKLQMQRCTKVSLHSWEWNRIRHDVKRIAITSQRFPITTQRFPMTAQRSPGRGPVRTCGQRPHGPEAVRLSSASSANLATPVPTDVHNRLTSKIGSFEIFLPKQLDYLLIRIPCPDAVYLLYC